MIIIEHRSAEDRAAFLRTWYLLTRRTVGNVALQLGAL
jgi:hypothetical protein